MKLSALLRNYNKRTNQPTGRQTGRTDWDREVPLPINGAYVRQICKLQLWFVSLAASSPVARRAELVATEGKVELVVS